MERRAKQGTLEKPRGGAESGLVPGGQGGSWDRGLNVSCRAFSSVRGSICIKACRDGANGDRTIGSKRED